MIKGFSLMEILAALSLLGMIVGVIMTHTTDMARSSDKIIKTQQRVEGIFHVVETMKSDLTKCGKRLSRCAALYGFPLFSCETDGFRVTYGEAEEVLQADGKKGAAEISLFRNEFFSVKRDILMYDPITGLFQFNTIKEVKSSRVTLQTRLLYDFPRNCPVVALKKVEYKLYGKEQTLKRKLNNGYFQPVLHHVTSFKVQYFPDAVSALYSLEIDKKEQIMGYIFMTNMAPL